MQFWTLSPLAPRCLGRSSMTFGRLRTQTMCAGFFIEGSSDVNEKKSFSSCFGID
jgi:hypothetical protein